jgi:hypothetical protein
MHSFHHLDLIFRPCRDWRGRKTTFPALKRWAIFEVLLARKTPPGIFQPGGAFGLPWGFAEPF